MDYEVQHSSRRCSITGREFAPGEAYYSAIVAQGAEVIRHDYAADAWQGPPAEALGWWKSRIPDRNETKKRWAPNDVMLQFWDELAAQPEQQDMRYVLTLLLVRRRVFRLEEEKYDEQGREVLVVECPRREATYEVSVVVPEATRIEQIQQELAALLQ
jgi:ribosomal protein L28